LNGSLDQSTPIIGNVDSDLNLNITTVGNDTIYFDGSNQNLEQLVVDVTGGNIVLTSTLHINDELTLTNGSIELANDNLIIEQNANITGYSNTRYIMTPGSGQLEMYIPASSTYMVFPIGTETSYSPASIQQTTGTGGKFKVKAFSGIYSGGTENSGFNSATSGSVVNRTWLVESDMTSFNLNLKLGWMATSEVNGFDRTNAFISHYTSGSWDTYAAGSAVAGANSTYEINRTGITSLSPFAVAEESTQLTVDEMALLNINLYPNPCTDALNINYANANGIQYACQVTDIAGRNQDVVFTDNNQIDVSRLNQGTYLLKMTNPETNKVSIRQFIKK
jgi:type IX secretion system substrate protein